MSTTTTALHSGNGPPTCMPDSFLAFLVLKYVFTFVKLQNLTYLLYFDTLGKYEPTYSCWLT